MVYYMLPNCLNTLILIVYEKRYTWSRSKRGCIEVEDVWIQKYFGLCFHWEYLRASLTRGVGGGAGGRVAGWPGGRVAGWPGSRVAGWPGSRVAG